MHQTPKNHADRSRQSGVTWRSVLIAAALIPANTFWIIDSVGQGFPTTVSLFFNVIFCVFCLIGLNFLVSRVLPRAALNQGELLTIYVMVSLASALAGHDLLRVLVPMIGHAFHFATPENEWGALFHRFVPDWLAVKDVDFLDEFYEGESSLYTKRNLATWARPTLLWTGFLLALATVMLALNLLVRKQWTENEKLSYPIIQLPLEMTEGGGLRGVLASPLLWIGFGFAGAVDVLNGLNYLYPAVPSLGGKLYDLVPVFFMNKPWSAMSWMPLALFPFAVGMAFFIPLDLSFSSWFFYLFWKAERVVGDAVGLRNIPGFPYVDEQSLGAYIGLFIIAVVGSRGHLKHVGARLAGRGSADYERGEPFRYRTMVVILTLAGAYLIVFSRAAGMSPWVIATFFIVYFAIAVAVTRMRAELGSPVHDLHFIGPDEMMPRMFGTRILGPRNLTMFAYYFFFNRAHRGHPMPHQLEGFKLAERAGVNYRRLFYAMLFAMLLGILSTFWAYYHLSYQEGARAWFAQHPFDRLQNWMTAPRSPDVGASVAVSAGLVQTLFLMVMRMRFVWWPFHPAGFAISSSWSMNVFWFSIFISTVVKWVILRQGGLVLHRRAVPFFLGLILGEFVVGSVWSIIGCVVNRPMYRFLY